MSSILLPFDIETSHLKADFGTILSFGYQRWTVRDGEYEALDAEPVVLTSTAATIKRDPTDDKDLCRRIRKVMLDADIWIGYYSKGFDLKFIQAKLGEHRLGYLPPMGRAHVDLFYAAKSAFALSRKSLGNVSYHLGVEGSKTPVEGRIWKKAMVGNKEALRYIVEHNKADVSLTWNLYRELLPLMPGHAFVGNKTYCNRCDQPMQRRGLARTATVKDQFRFSCPNGHWITK